MKKNVMRSCYRTQVYPFFNIDKDFHKWLCMKWISALPVRIRLVFWYVWLFLPPVNSRLFWDNFELFKIGEFWESDASAVEVELMLLAAELLDAEVKTFVETVKFGQFVLSLCLRSSSWCVGMFGDTGSDVGVLLPGCRFNPARGEVAGDGLRDEVVLDKYVGVKVFPCPLVITDSCWVCGERFLWPQIIPWLSPDIGVVAGDGGVFKIIRFGCRIW